MKLDIHTVLCQKELERSTMILLRYIVIDQITMVTFRLTKVDFLYVRLIRQKSTEQIFCLKILEIVTRKKHFWTENHVFYDDF